MIYGKRRPNLTYFVNSDPCKAELTWSEKKTNYLEHTVWSLQTSMADKNLFEIKMTDKTDDDLLIQADEIVDHFVEIKNIDIDGIMIDHLVHKVGVFRHCMPDSWVAMMRERGIGIESTYTKTTQIRLNGTWSMEFDLPLWQWCARLSQ